MKFNYEENKFLITGRICRIEKKSFDKNGKTYYVTEGSVEVDTDLEKNDANRYINFKALFQKTKMLADFIKGDYVFMTATKEDREYNGKVYTDYLIDFCIKANGSAENVALGQQPQAIAPIDDKDLPF